MLYMYVIKCLVYMLIGFKNGYKIKRNLKKDWI